MRRNILTPEELTLFTAEFGTKEWALRKKQRLEKMVDAAEGDMIDLDIEAVEFIKGEGWVLLPRNEAGELFRVFSEFAMTERPYGLGCTDKQFRIMIAVCDAMTPTQERAAEVEIQSTRTEAMLGNDNASPIHATITKNSVDNCQHCFSDSGNSADYLTARIARDHPAIYQNMLRGEYKSVRQAAIAAGIVHPQTRYSLSADAQSAGRYLAERVDDEWMRAMVEAYEDACDAALAKEIREGVESGEIETVPWEEVEAGLKEKGML